MILDLNEQAKEAQEAYVKEQLEAEGQVLSTEDELN